MKTDTLPALPVLILLVLLGCCGNAWSAEPLAQESGATTETAVPLGLRSPRATMETFLHAMNDIKRGKPEQIDTATSTLDLGAVNPLVRTERGRDLAWTLLEVMDRTRKVDPAKIPAREEGRPWLFQRYAAGSVVISRRPDGRWLFDGDTVARLPEILETLADKARVTGVEGGASHLPWHLRLREQLPAVLKQRSFLLENWHWLGLLATVTVGVVLDWLTTLLLRLMVRHWRDRKGYEPLKGVEDDLLRPLGLMVMALIWWAGINLLGLPEDALLILLVAVKFLASAAGVWGAYRLVDLVAAVLTERARRSENKIDDMLAPLIPRTLKVFITVVGIVFVADNLNIDVSGLLAGLGLGGLAFALAAKDMVQNLFGSVTVLLDRTFSVGDWIIVDGSEGSVERIGFRSTRIRTFYNSLLTVPNSKFITATVDNMGERRYRRLSTKFTITYNTPPDRIESFCEGLRELVRQHPYMRKDYFHVYLNGLGDSALEVLVYVFWETPDWSTELRERHRFLLDCLRVAERLGVEFAFPTQTLYMVQDETRPLGGEEPAEQALQQGRDVARDVVAQTTGLGVRPPPVHFE